MSAKSGLANQNDAESSSTVDCSAGVPPAVSGASRPRFGEVTIRNRGRLPHWEKDSATYFITFRLVDSITSHIPSSRALFQEPCNTSTTNVTACFPGA